MCKTTITIIILFIGTNVANAQGGILHMSTAGNFGSILEKLSELFTQQTAHEFVIIKSATRVLYTQITQGVPFDVFLSADVERVQKLKKDNTAVKNIPKPRYCIIPDNYHVPN